MVYDGNDWHALQYQKEYGEMYCDDLIYQTAFGEMYDDDLIYQTEYGKM